MRDELDRRVVRALSAEGHAFTLTVTPEEVEDRLSRSTGSPWLAPLTAVLGIAVVLLVVLAIGPGRGLPIGDRSPSPSASPAFPDDPCALLTAAEISAVTGDEVSDGRPLSDEERIDPSAPPLCVYRTDGMHGDLSVTIDSAGSKEFSAWRDANRANLIPFAGLGDEAYSHGGGSIHVRIGSRSFAISSQYGAGEGRPAMEDLQRLAELALVRVGPEPSVIELPAGTWVSRSAFRNGSICVAIEVEQPPAGSHRAWGWHPGGSGDCESRSGPIVQTEARTGEVPLVRIEMPTIARGSQTLSLRFTGYTDDGFTLDTVLFQEVDAVDPVERP